MIMTETYFSSPVWGTHPVDSKTGLLALPDGTFWRLSNASTGSTWLRLMRVDTKTQRVRVRRANWWLRRDAEYKEIEVETFTEVFSTVIPKDYPTRDDINRSASYVLDKLGSNVRVYKGDYR